MFFTVLINLPYLLYKLEALWLSLLLHTLTHTVKVSCHVVVPSELCHGSKQQMTCRWRRGGMMNRGRLEEGKWELQPFVSIFSPIFVLLDRCSSFTSVRQRRTIARSKTCLSVSYSLPVSLLFLLLCHSAMKAAANTDTHIHTQAHSKTSGYAYYMSPPPLKASLLFSFCNLQQRWWGRSWFLHLRAVSSLYCRSCSLWLKRVCTAISNINIKFSNVFV